MPKRSLFAPLAVRFALVLLAAICGITERVHAQFVVPGTGQRVQLVGDDFEESDWAWYMNEPKASANLDNQQRLPSGGAKNGRILESIYRGQPDMVKRVATPAGGLPGSTSSLLMMSVHTGIPGTTSRDFQQDDLIVNVSGRIGRAFSPSECPNFVVRVYMPEFDEWENRTGSSLGVRMDLQTTITESKRGFFGSRQSKKGEAYWPGFFVNFNSKTDGRNKVDSANFLIRANSNGNELAGPAIKGAGWWTLGMSLTPDGRVHYFAKEGIENLTAADHITSQFPYSYRAESMGTFFFNIVSANDGKSWSTPWIIDDPMLYVAPGARLVSKPAVVVPKAPSAEDPSEIAPAAAAVKPAETSVKPATVSEKAAEPAAPKELAKPLVEDAQPVKAEVNPVDAPKPEEAESAQPAAN
jgi:hypothetical protein